MSILAKVPRTYKLWVKARLGGVRRAYVRAFRSYDAAQLVSALRSLGIQSGDSVMLHGAFTPDHGFRGSIHELTNAFIEAIGPTGNLLMVSMPYLASAHEYLTTLNRFDVRKTPSMMGLISEFFRRRPEVVRSLHPTHPVLVQGPRAEWFVAGHEQCLYSCGPGSPFEHLAEADGKVVFFNVSHLSFTFYHYLEHLVSPDLPFSLYNEKPFEVKVVDRNGNQQVMRTHVSSAETIRRRRPEILWNSMFQEGLVTERRIGNSHIRAVRVRDAIDCVRRMRERGVYFYDLE